MLYSLCYEIQGGGGELDTFAYSLKSAGEEFKISEVVLPPPPSLSQQIATFIQRQHLLKRHELHDRVSQTSEHRKRHFSLKYGLKALAKGDFAE